MYNFEKMQQIRLLQGISISHIKTQFYAIFLSPPFCCIGDELL